VFAFYEGIDIIFYGYYFLIVFPVIVGIEAVALYNIFNIFKDKDGAWVVLASIVINLISSILNLILFINLPPILVAPLIENYTAVPVTVFTTVLLNVFIELVVLKVVFKPTLSVVRVLAFILINTITLIILLYATKLFWGT